MTATIQPRSSGVQQEFPASPWPEFVGSWPRLRGNQEPAFESRWPGDESEGDRCAQFGFNLASKYGTKTRLMPWEWHTVRGSLSLQPANEYGERVWTHRDVVLECTRQQGKTLIVVLLILFHLFVAPAFGRARPLKIVYTAQRWSTAKDVFERTVRVINRVPWLKRRLVKAPTTRDNHGVIEVAIERDAQGNPTVVAVAEFAPRSQEFGRGITELDILFLDEAYDLDPGIENDLTGAQSAADNPQTFYLSTPPVLLKHPKCHSLADMHRLGHARGKHLFYRLFAAPKTMSRNDPETWIAAEPSFGVSIDEREVESKLAKAKTAVKRAIFDADYCGWGDYPPPESDEGSEIPGDRWFAMGPRSGLPKLVGSPVVAVDRQEGSGIWLITGGQYTDGGRAHLEIGYSRTADSTAVVAAVVELVTAWDPAVVAIKAKGDAAAIEAELIKAGVEPEMVSATVYSQWCGGFLNAATSGMLSHSDQSELDDAASSAMRRNVTGGGFVWDDAAAGSSAAGLRCATLAHGALLAFSKPAKPIPLAPVVASSRAAAFSGGDDGNFMRMSF